jgi:hypothetical protein
LFFVFKVDEANLQRIGGYVQEISAGKWVFPTNGGKIPVKIAREVGRRRREEKRMGRKVYLCLVLSLLTGRIMKRKAVSHESGNPGW